MTTPINYLAVIKVVGVGGGGTNAVNRMVDRLSGAVRGIANSATALASIQRAGLEPSEIDLFIPHQANIRILEAVASQLNVGMERFPSNLSRYGNTSAASIPLALEEAWQDGKIKHGDLILIVAFGAGLTWGSCLTRWEL